MGIAQAISCHLDVIPPIFNKCTKTISYEDEETARDQYWKVLVDEAKLDIEEQITLLQNCISLNPFVGEPHALLAQLYFRKGDFNLAAVEAAKALEKMYELAT